VVGAHALGGVGLVAPDGDVQHVDGSLEFWTVSIEQFTRHLRSVAVVELGFGVAVLCRRRLVLATNRER
jgi:hypothetical protein